MKSLPSIWHFLHNFKSTVKISSIFVVFLEIKNFKVRRTLMMFQLPRLRCLFLSYQMQKTPKTGQSLRPFLIRDNFSALFVLLCLSLNVNSRNRNISFGHVRSSNKFYLSFNPVGENFRTQLKPIYIHSVVLVSYLAKLTRVKRVVSKSCATIKGPSTRINGILGKAILPSCIAWILMSFGVKFAKYV